jgi:hypothetical protein
VQNSRQPRHININRGIPSGPPDDATLVDGFATDSDEPTPREILEQRIRAAYVRERRRYMASRGQGRDSRFGDGPIPCWDGGKDSHGTTHKAVWPQVAELLIANRCLAPEQFMQAQFVGRHLPKHTQIHSDAAWRRFMDHHNAVRERLEQSLASDKRTFSTWVHDARAWYPDKSKEWYWRYVLDTPDADLSNLFRFTAAESEVLDDVMAVTHDAALAQYLRDPDGYDMYWKEWVSVLIRQEARKFLSEIS